MEFAAIGLVVLALAVFFVLKKTKKTKIEDSKPEIVPTLESVANEASPRPPKEATPAEAETPPLAQEPVQSPATGETRNAVESIHAEVDDAPTEGAWDAEETDSTHEDVHQETAEAPPEDASPPPPPTREKGTPTPQPIGRKAELQSLRKGLAKSRSGTGFFGLLKGLFSASKEIDPQIAERIEEVLLSSDVGVKTTEAILQRIRGNLDRGELKNEAQVWETLRDEARRTLSVDGRMGGITIGHRPTVVLLVGVNGAGKTTTIGKLAQQFIGSGKKVMLAAGDTFRAAAVDQLKAWGDRVGCEVVSGKDGADPSSVLFDAIQRAQESGVDVLLADTAGRLHTKTNLMQEMAKISKTLGKALPGAPHEVLLVIDSTNGQNAMAQAREFKEVLSITGLVLTKLDGTARGGVVLGICDGLQVPVRYIGVGERTDDLLEFDTNAFVEALLGSDESWIAA